MKKSETHPMSHKISLWETMKNGKIEKLKELEDKVKEAKNNVSETKEEIHDIEEKINEYKDTILLNAMVHGAKFMVKHGMTAPYTHAYYITRIDDYKYLCDFCEKVTSGYNDWWNHLPKALRKVLDTEKGWTLEDYKKLEECTREIVKKLPKGYNPNEYKPSSSYLHGNHIANGYEKDGFANIIRGRCGGSYSSMTTSTQNDLSRDLIVMRGYCADNDYIHSRSNNNDKEFWKIVKKLYKMNNMDYEHIHEDPHIREQEWAKANPHKCMPDNKYYLG